MAANLDKAESSLTTVSDLAYIRGVDASGNSVKISKSDLALVLGVTPPANVVRKVTFGSTGNVQRYVYVGRLDYSTDADVYMSFFIDGFSNYAGIGRNKGFVTFGSRGTATMSKVLVETAGPMSFGYVKNGDHIDFYMSAQGTWICASTVVEFTTSNGEFIMQEIGALPDNITLFQ